MRPRRGQVMANNYVLHCWTRRDRFPSHKAWRRNRGWSWMDRTVIERALEPSREGQHSSFRPRGVVSSCAVRCSVRGPQARHEYPWRIWGWHTAALELGFNRATKIRSFQ